MTTQTTIRSALHSLVTDREYCMDNGHMTKSMDLVKICTNLRRELDWHRNHGLNAHRAIVRTHEHDIRKLADTIGKKRHFRQQVLDMIDQITCQPVHHK